MISRIGVLLLLALSFGGCSRAREYDMRGQVLAVDRGKSEILVNHEEIPGFMSAMTMPYKVRDSSVLDGLAPGDLIAARLAVSDSGAVVTSAQKTGTAPLQTPPPAPVARSGFELIRIGEQVPDQDFIDQDGRSQTLSAIRDGRALALTFIYTRARCRPSVPHGSELRGPPEAGRSEPRRRLHPPAVGELRPAVRHAARPQGARRRAWGEPGALDVRHGQP